MTLNHTEKIQIGNIWVDEIKEKKSVHVEELREILEVKKGKQLSFTDFYDFKKFFEWKWQNVVRYNKPQRSYEMIKPELDEEEAKNLV